MVDENRTEIRFWELDLFRGVAIILMIIFHVVYDLYYFEVYDFDIHKTIWIYLAVFVFTIFFLLVGVSLTLNYAKGIINQKSEKQIFYQNFVRGLKIFCWGLLITLLTWLVIRENYVMFGVLHFIGLSIMIAYPFLRSSHLNVLLGAIIVALGLLLRTAYFDFSWLVWLGFRPHNFNTVDYFPLLPYFGMVLIGIAIGNILYKNYKRRFHIPDLSKYTGIRFINFLGRHSLVIYLLHQPILILTLMGLGFVNI